MRTKKEIQEKIEELTINFEIAEESYFSALETKQKGKKISQVDFIKLESEYEILKKEIETLQWVLSEMGCGHINLNKINNESANGNKKRSRPSSIL